MSDNLKAVFQDFAVQGKGKDAPKNDKTTISNKNVTKLMKDCKLFGKNLTSQGADIAFSKYVTKGKKDLTFDQFVSFLKELSPKYQTDHKLETEAVALEKMKEKIGNSKISHAGTTGTSKTGAVDKMTDTSQYTGASKGRFDESGKGKGIEGRADRADNSGYVGAYKGDGSYGKK